MMSALEMTHMILTPCQSHKEGAARGARSAHGAPGHVRLATPMSSDAHVRCKSPPHSVPSPGAMLSSIPQTPGYLNDAAGAVRGRHPQWAVDSVTSKIVHSFIRTREHLLFPCI